MARHNIVQALCADVPSPPHAGGDVSEWEEWGDGYGRLYTVSVREVGDMSVEVLGVQFDDGRTQLSLLVREADQMSADQGRQLAATLVDAADEIDGLG
ncbi:hypothetical protein GBO17_15345 [Mycobacterium avium subsp. hominissuis]|nr:hypothetical protein [Mycobacterium avium]MBZ4569836.1 hypothetical protein [Mycobacterium avium subsp. hominissuis]MBZ4589571.1 hypothetical protein [Mycobacterium avium subsp. hominissuis]